MRFGQYAQREAISQNHDRRSSCSCGKISESESVVICLFTSFENTGLTTRVKVFPSQKNGLSKVCYIMVEKIISVKQSELGEKIGELENEYLESAEDILKDLLGF